MTRIGKPEAVWQRCYVHFLRNALDYLPRKADDDCRQTDRSGFVTIVNGEGRVVSNPGGTTPTYRDGALQLMVQQEPIFDHCHDVCVDGDKNLYVCQWNAGQTYPIKLERV